MSFEILNTQIRSEFKTALKVDAAHGKRKLYEILDMILYDHYKQGGHNARNIGKAKEKDIGII